KRSTDANGVRGPFWESLARGAAELPPAEGSSLTQEEIDPVKAKIYGAEFERTASFMSGGGIAAVHAEGRGRQAIWDAMQRREVYGTSGHRILLWFDLLNADSSGTPKPMGSEVKLSEPPRFRVSAVGSFKQLPGCPDYIDRALEKRQLEKMAGGECYYPSNERHHIERIEVIKIEPQLFASESVTNLIQENWRIFDCSPSADGCEIEFSDPDFAEQGRDALYYVRAIEEAVPTINAGNLRTRFDEDGQPESMSPCNGDYRTKATDDCLKPAGQRAWSSPIFVDYKKS
ncbi:MAG: hypothetical protein ACI9GW_001184, partial [Halieaceae bacterium]